MTAAVFTNVSDGSTTGQRPQQSCRGSKNYFYEFPGFVQHKEYGRLKNLATIPSQGELFQILNIKKLDLVTELSTFPSVRVILCNLLHFESVPLNLLNLSWDLNTNIYTGGGQSPEYLKG